MFAVLLQVGELNILRGKNALNQSAVISEMIVNFFHPDSKSTERYEVPNLADGFL